jgi:hypothetical protein
VCHASYGDTVREEHNTKQVRPHVWLEQDNDAGLQFRSYREGGTESLLAERPGHGLITEDWNETNWIWQKLRFEGRRLRGKYWPAHKPEPDGWALDTEYDGVAEGVAVYSVKLGLRDFCKSVTTLGWMWINSDRMSPRERWNSIDWSS